jgi:hypothetical protein
MAMRILFAAGALLAVTIGIAGPAFAQARAPVHRYCLLERSGGGSGGTGGEAMLCRFNTLAQCMASKTGNTDTCIVNPQLTFPPR